MSTKNKTTLKQFEEDVNAIFAGHRSNDEVRLVEGNEVLLSTTLDLGESIKKGNRHFS